jgi:predicted unusual protein kinase regulating ubiquinone biosynthesis (AarF/ABC1/UbiB family)
MRSVSDGEPPSDPGEAQPFYDGIGLRLQRAMPVAALGARTVGEAAVVGLRGRLTGASSADFHVRTAERYAELLGRSKGALMKAGQMLSFTPVNPLVPAESQGIYREALARLRDDAPPMAPGIARTVLEHELEAPVERLFARFDWSPIAAASIGQVHAARLRDGRAVAVKIQYPSAAEAIRADLKNNELLAALLAFTFALSPGRISFDVRGAAQELSALIGEELDYRLEAAHQMEFADLYRRHPFIHVPEVVGELCTERVLTQELKQGKRWSEALRCDQELRDSWAEAIYRFVWATNRRSGLFHADPNPGNYVFHDDGSVSFLDYGCVKRFEREHVALLEAIARACLRGDVLGTWEKSVEAGLWRACDPVSPEKIFAYWREPWELWWAEQPFTVTPEHAARWIERRFSPVGPSANAFRHIVASPEHTIMTRVEVGQTHLIAELRATNHWGSIAAEIFEGTEPLTAMGKLERAFFLERSAAVSAPGRES